MESRLAGRLKLPASRTRFFGLYSEGSGPSGGRPLLADSVIFATKTLSELSTVATVLVERDRTPGRPVATEGEPNLH